MQIPSEVKEVTAEVRGPHDEHVLSSFAKESDGDFHLRFTPHKKGTYTVDVRCKGKSVEGSPFRYVISSSLSVLHCSQKTFDTKQKIGGRL